MIEMKEYNWDEIVTMVEESQKIIEQQKRDGTYYQLQELSRWFDAIDYFISKDKK